MEEFNFQEGEVLLIDKPLNWTSFDVVNKIRKHICLFLGIKKLKVGHAGTLDPLATGLIILCTGKKTKEIEKYQAQTKEYIATITLGATTPSFDLETDIDKVYDYLFVTKELVINTLNNFIGEQVQSPPIFSAKKVNGKRAYISARKGEQVKIKQNYINIYSIELLEYNLPELKLKITCSKGTYIRTLANDIGKFLKCGAYLSALCRTKIGDFKISDAYSVKNIIDKLVI